ncbi:hypothetical protein MAP00_008939 [Monascus purpureus]|nr:hypothetical protein MAP00_008939 [Monascus purpureus]
MALSSGIDGNLAVRSESLVQQYLQEKPTVEPSLQKSVIPAVRPLSTFERVFTTHAPVLESLLLLIPTDTILKLYQTSSYLRNFLSSYPTAWKYLSFRLFYPSGTQPPGGAHVVIPGSLTADPANPRRSQPYALDQLLMNVLVPFSPCLTMLELDNTAVSGQILISIVLHSRRETLEHLSVRGCKNVSLKYHIVPYLTMFGLQYDVDMARNIGSSPATKRLALKSLYTYRCRHHRRRPYLSSSLTRKDSDSEPTHELVNLCHKLGIWTDTAWCTTPAGRCLRRRGYVSMRVPQGSPEVWVVFDRLWRSKNWIGPVEQTGRPPRRDGKLWEHEETGCYGEPLGTGHGGDFGEGKMKPAHLRQSHRQFVENIRCDNCCETIAERCEQCSILMHCVGCRKTLCASCAYERPYPRLRLRSESSLLLSSSSSAAPEQSLWWAPGATISPCLMHDPLALDHTENNVNNAPFNTYPAIKFHWCCTEPIFSGGGGISIGSPGRDVDVVRAVPLPKGQGWEDTEYSVNEWSRTFPKDAYGNPNNPDYSLETGHLTMMKWLLGSPSRQVSACPRNLCQECYDSPQWKVHCKCCSKPLCIEHDLRGLRLRICGYRDLALERLAIQSRAGASSQGSNNSLGTLNPASRVWPPFRPPRVPDSTGSSLSDGNPVDGLINFDSAVLQDPLEPALPRTSRASRSFSATKSIHSRSSSPSSIEFESSLEEAKWQGCQSFFCPQYRAVGDQRQRCNSVLRECTTCSVYVCQDCVNANPPCRCSFCETNYRCPNCRKVRENDGMCRKLEEEERERRRIQWKKDRDALQGIIERRMADEMAGFAQQFFTCLYGRYSEETFGQQQYEDQNAEMMDLDEEFSANFFDSIGTGVAEEIEDVEATGADDEPFANRPGVEDDSPTFDGSDEETHGI